MRATLRHRRGVGISPKTTETLPGSIWHSSTPQRATGLDEFMLPLPDNVATSVLYPFSPPPSSSPMTPPSSAASSCSSAKPGVGKPIAIVPCQASCAC